MQFSPKQVELPNRDKKKNYDGSAVHEEANTNSKKKKDSSCKSVQVKSKLCNDDVFNVFLSAFLFVVLLMLFSFIFPVLSAIISGTKFNFIEIIFVVILCGLFIVISRLFFKSIKKALLLIKPLFLKYVKCVETQIGDTGGWVIIRGNKVSPKVARLVLKLDIVIWGIFSFFPIIQGEIFMGIFMGIMGCIILPFLLTPLVIQIKKAESFRAKRKINENSKGIKIWN